MCFVKEKNGLGLSILFCRATLVHGNDNFCDELDSAEPLIKVRLYDRGLCQFQGRNGCAFVK